MAKIHAGLKYDDQTIQEVFDRGDLYQVPKYQRGYSWTDENVRELLDDLKEAYDDTPREVYLLGQIIVCPGAQNIPELDSWDVIDGQQRLTTLYLIVLQIFMLIDAEPVQNMTMRRQQQFAEIRTNLFRFSDDDDDDPIPRLRVAADGETYLMSIVKKKPFPEEDSSPSQQRIREAYEEIEEFFRAKFETLDDCWKFLDYVLQGVVLIRLTLENANHALRVFLKVNNRGLALDDADLLKSLLFQKVSSETDYSTMSASWDKATRLIFKANFKKAKSMEFLMKLLIGIRTGKSVTTGHVFQQWSGLLQTENDAKDFARQLPGKALNLNRISHNKTPLTPSQLTEDNFGTSLLKMVQHYEVLLAADHLSAQSYTFVAKIIEERAMLSTLAGEKNQDFERKVHNWANLVYGLPGKATFDEVRLALDDAYQDFEPLFRDLRSEIQKLTYGTRSHQLKLRYVLARVAKFSQEAAHSSVIPLSVYMQTTKKNGKDKGYDLDHVFPKSDKKRALWKQPIPEAGEDIVIESDRIADSLVNSIGNLVLLAPSDNRDQSDTPPWEKLKIDNYDKSELWINRTLVKMRDDLPGSADKKLFMTWQKTSPPDLANWSSKQILLRTELYCSILESSMRQNLGM